MPRGAPGHNSTRRAADGRESVAGGLRSGMEQVKAKQQRIPLQIHYELITWNMIKYDGIWRNMMEYERI